MSSRPWLPPFDDDWVNRCASLIANSRGLPPNLDCFAFAFATFPGHPPSDEAFDRPLLDHLKHNAYSINARFTVLSWLWAAWTAPFQPLDDLGIKDDLTDEEESGRDREKDLWHCAIWLYLEDGPVEAITSSDHFKWELRQAFLAGSRERLKHLVDRGVAIEEWRRDEADCLLGRILWYWHGPSWAEFVFDNAKGEQRWQKFLDGDPGTISRMIAAPPESCVPGDKRLLLEADGCLEKAQQERDIGVHWGIRASIAAALGKPDTCAQIWAEHGANFLDPFAREIGRTGIELLKVPDYGIALADLWSQAGRPDREIACLENLLEDGRGPQGVNRRLAELYWRWNQPETALERLRAEAQGDEAFKEDPIVSLLLKTADRIDTELSKDRNSPASRGERQAMAKVLELSWPPYGRMSEAAKEDFIEGLWWFCGGEDGGSERRLRHAVLCSVCAVETHLRQSVFEELQRSVESRGFEIDGLKDPKLKIFLRSNGELSLGDMLDALSKASSNAGFVFKTLGDLLKKKSGRIDDLKGAAFRQLAQFRNPLAHDSRNTVTAEQARRCLGLCMEFLNTLEGEPPPITKPLPRQPL